MKPRFVQCPTCGANPGKACHDLVSSGWIGGEEYHSARVAKAAPATGGGDGNRDPQDDPANYRADRPAVFPQGNAHDHQEDQ